MPSDTQYFKNLAKAIELKLSNNRIRGSDFLVKVLANFKWELSFLSVSVIVILHVCACENVVDTISVYVTLLKTKNTLSVCLTDHDKTVSSPQRTPTVRTVRDGYGLAVHGDHSGWRFTHGTSAKNSAINYSPRTRHGFVRRVVNMSRRKRRKSIKPGYVFGNVQSQNGCHHYRHRLRGAQPVAVIVSTRVIAYFVQVAEHEGHRVESPQTTTRCA